jgi:hypothetical protein
MWVPVADVHQLGLKLVNGLPAKTLESCRSSLRSAQAASSNYFNVRHRPWTPPKILPYGPLMPPNRKFGD